MKVMNEKNKNLTGRGFGDHATYKPWILPREVPGLGVCSYVRDPYHGRMMSLLSQGEYMLYLKLRWRQDVDDIREQFPLNLADTNRIAEEFGYRKAGNGRFHMTTDQLVTLTDGSLEAYSVKSTHEDAEKRRTREKLEVEEAYWAERGISWHLVCKEDLDHIEFMNLRDIFAAFDTRFLHDEMGWIRHLIATRVIPVDMTKRIDYAALEREYKEKKDWQECVSRLMTR